MGPFLSADERYEVWIVKAAERPELLAPPPSFVDTRSDDDDDDENEPNESVDERASDLETKARLEWTDNEAQKENATHETDDPPLTDGCDLESWRRHKFVPVSGSVLAVLNVGQGCHLLRRERQVPVLSSRALQEWENLKESLMVLPQASKPVGLVPRTEADQLGVHPWFERQNVPAILLGCTVNWRAMETCRFESLVRRFGELPWRFSDTHGETMTLRTYQKYVNSLEGQLDDAPLAVYDSQFHLDERAEILDEYDVPSCFRSDLFDHLDEDDRPPYRWILIGPARSGTGLHVDPAGTHAWVTLVQGLKRWVLFPPSTCRRTIGMNGDYQIPSSIWFRDYYRTVMAGEAGREAVHVLQRPGETVYVPAGWPHLVLNLELSVAITQNYASEYPSMHDLWKAVQCEADVASHLKNRLQSHRPELFAMLVPESPGSRSDA